MNVVKSGTLLVRFDGSRSEFVERLFVRLSANYGKLLLEQWSAVDIDEVKAEWARQLHGTPVHRILYALDHLGTFPPTLPEFRQLCREAPYREEPASVHVLPAPTEPPLTLEQRKQKIAEMKAMLRKSPISGALTAAVSKIGNGE